MRRLNGYIVLFSVIVCTVASIWEHVSPEWAERSKPVIPKLHNSLSHLCRRMFLRPIETVFLFLITKTHLRLHDYCSITLIPKNNVANQRKYFVHVRSWHRHPAATATTTTTNAVIGSNARVQGCQIEYFGPARIYVGIARGSILQPFQLIMRCIYGCVFFLKCE